MYKKPQKGEYLEVLLRSPKTVFSVKDASLLWSENNEKRISLRLNKYVKSGKLFKIRRGLYAKDENYNNLEMATRINIPSYVSFETVLGKEGITFQNYENIFVASYVGREVIVNKKKISFIKMKDYVLSDISGITHDNGYACATKERAFLDRLYVSKDYYFDNLSSIDWDKVFKILPIYHNKRMEKVVNKQYEDFKNKK